MQVPSPSAVVSPWRRIVAALQFVTAVTAVGVPLTLPTFLHSLPHSTTHCPTHAAYFSYPKTPSATESLPTSAYQVASLPTNCKRNALQFVTAVSTAIGYLLHSLPSSYLAPSTSTPPPVALHLSPTPPSPKHRPILRCKCRLH